MSDEIVCQHVTDNSGNYIETCIVAFKGNIN